MDRHKNKQIFFPTAYKAAEQAKKEGNLFAYYTTADVAYSVIERKELWMRNTTTMNDYLELQYGHGLLSHAASQGPGKALKAAIEACHSELFKEVWARSEAWLPGFRLDTYITCVSQHLNEEKDFGRLSMWRAYGGKTGVALVFNGAAFDLQTGALGYSSPVAYFTKQEFSESMEQVAANVITHRDYVAALPREVVQNLLFNVFRFAVMCTKHPGFKEEKEWRIIASPALDPGLRLREEVAVVRGVPQNILKIPLENVPEQGITGLAIPELINRIIIGPCEFPEVTYRALWRAAEKAGVKGPTDLIFQSHIPLRHI